MESCKCWNPGMTRYSRRSPSPPRPRKRTKRDLSNGKSTKESQMDTQDIENETSSPGSMSWSCWSVEELADHLEEQSMEDIADAFREEEIKGRNLPLVTDEMLRNMGIKKLGQILDFQQFKERLGCASSLQNLYHPNTKIFNDPIHGHIELHPLCVKIIDTPQFQRLRFLRQLGGCYFVFPGASHNRFEHSIGVCHLAGQLARVLQRRQPELKISNEDVLCVEIAGLCHDLGHGPFSHMFDGEFIPRTCNGRKWKHEDGSVMMFDHLVRENHLEAEFEKFSLYETDRIFIKEQIRGPLHATETQTGYEYKGRGKDKSFLYEIVANKRNGIDVDKWDYFARDCHMLGIRNNFDHNRFMKFSRVIQVNDVMQICARDKEACTLYDMFNTRSSLHRRAYQHKVSKIIETMITEALIKANDHIKIPGKDGKMLKMSECVDDMFAYTKLTDSILQQIMMTTEPELEPSRTIINNILRRRLYKCVGQSQPISNNVIKREEMALMKSQLIECMSEEDKDSETPLTEEDIVLHMVYLDYGMKDKNPMDNVSFYNKANPDKAVKVRKSEVSNMLPERFAEQMILVYCKDLKSDSKFGIASRCFLNWCSKHNMETPKQSVWELTPVIKRGSSEGTPVTPSNDSREGTTKPETPSTAGKFKQKLIF